MDETSYSTCIAACGLSTTTTTTTTTTTGPVSITIQLDEYDGGNPPYLDMDMVVAGSTYYYDSGVYTQNVPTNAYSTITLKTKDGIASHTWGSFTTASATLKVFEDGVLIVNQTNYYRKNEGAVDFTTSVPFSYGKTYIVSGSNWTYSGAPPTNTTTTTSTSTTTTTAAPSSYVHLISFGYSYVPCTGGSDITVYGDNSDFFSVTRFYTDSGLSTPFNGNDLWYGDQYFSSGANIQINSSGYIIDYYGC
jgi:hypothetical protein